MSEREIWKLELHVDRSHCDERGEEIDIQKVVLNGKEVTNLDYSMCDSTDWILFKNESGSSYVCVTEVLTM